MEACHQTYHGQLGFPLLPLVPSVTIIVTVSHEFISCVCLQILVIPEIRELQSSARSSSDVLTFTTHIILGITFPFAFISNHLAIIDDCGVCLVDKYIFNCYIIG